MKRLLSVLILLSFHLGFSQRTFEKLPDGANEIHFSYKQTGKLLIDESGVYADSLFFKKNFPKIKVGKVDNPAKYY